MKAIYVNRYGGLDALEYGDLPDPVAGPGEVVVDIHAASVNAADVKVREGATKNTSTPRADTFPCILGRDFSGVVAFTFTASDGAALYNTFQAIGREISQLRVAG